MKVLRRIKAELKFMQLWLHSLKYYKQDCIEGKIDKRPEGDFCDLATVAFNNSNVIEYQIRTLKKFFTYPYRYSVFDNSSDDSKAEAIKSVCKFFDVGYIRLPKQDFLPSGWGSYSHGLACNYLYRNYIRNGGVSTLGC
ncbi:MAG: hypothetical protein ACI4A7_08510 [Prevotella sp.]